MPAASEYETSSTEEARQRVELGDKEFKQRRDLVLGNKEYYDGEHRRHLLVDDNGIDDNVVVNWSRMAIDRTVAFLLPDMPVLEYDLDETTEDEEALRQVWTDNGGVVALGNMAVNGALGGQVFSRVVERENGAVSILNMSPADIIIWYDQDDITRTLWYELRWGRKDGKYQNRQDVVALHDSDGNVEAWEILDFVNAGSKWQQIDGAGWKWPYGPIIDWQHLPRPNAIYGADELEHKALNDAGNKIASDIKKIIRFHAGPRTIGIGMGASEVQTTSIDGFWTVASEKAQIQNLEMQSDLGSSMAMLEKLEAAFFAQSRVVILKGGLDAFRGMTNLGIRAAFMDMIAKNETLRRQYTSGIQQISQTVMALLDRNAEIPPTVQWGQALPVDDREEVALIAQEMQLGIQSKRGAAKLRGRDYDVVRKEIEDEAIDDGVQFSGFPMPGTVTGRSDGF